jgi:hypothetical protein
MSTEMPDRRTRFFVVGLCVALLLVALAASEALRGSNGDAVTTKWALVYDVPEDDFVLEDISF